MRRVLILAGVLAGLALPSTAAAQAGTVCPLVDGPYEYQRALLNLAGDYWGSQHYNPAGGTEGAARRALGAQYTGFWFDTYRQGMSVAFAPGPLDAIAARAAIREELAADFTPDQIAFIDSKLNVLQDAYSEAELYAVRSQISALTSADGWHVGGGSIGCLETGSWRVTVQRIADKITPEVITDTEAVLAPFGDKVRITYCAGCKFSTLEGSVAAEPAPEPGPAPQAPQPPTATPAAMRVGDYVSRPLTSRCLHGTALSVRAKSAVKSVRLTAGPRHASASAGHTAKLRLTQHATRVTVTVTLKDGRSASQQLTYRRCG